MLRRVSVSLFSRALQGVNVDRVDVPINAVDKHHHLTHAHPEV